MQLVMHTVVHCIRQYYLFFCKPQKAINIMHLKTCVTTSIINKRYTVLSPTVNIISKVGERCKQYGTGNFLTYFPHIVL